MLVRLPNWVGDAVMATPALRALRAAHPEAEIAALGAAASRGPRCAALASFDAFLPLRGARVCATCARARVLRGRASTRRCCCPTRRARALDAVRSRASRCASATRAIRCAARCSAHAIASAARGAGRARRDLDDRALPAHHARARLRRRGRRARARTCDADGARGASRSGSRARASRAASACCSSHRARASARASSGRPSTSRARATRSPGALGLLPVVLAPGPGEEIAIAQRDRRARCRSARSCCASPPTSLAELVALIVARAALAAHQRHRAASHRGGARRARSSC